MRCMAIAWLVLYDAHDAYDAQDDTGFAGDPADAGCVPADAPANPDTNPDRFPEGLTAEYILGLARNFPDAALVELVQDGEVTYYRALDAESNLVGYAFASEGWGWCGMVVIITGVRPWGVTIWVEPVEYCWGEWIYSVTSLLDSTV